MANLIKAAVVQAVLIDRPKTVGVLRSMPVLLDEKPDAMLEPEKEMVCSD